MGNGFEAGEIGLEGLRGIAMGNGEPRQCSGQQELYEVIMNDWVE